MRSDPTPKPGSKEWQDQLNEDVARHDDQFAEDHPNWEQEHGTGGSR